MGMRSRGALLFSALGHTQVELARQLGVSKGVVGHWQIGHRKPGIPNRKAIFDLFGIPIEAWDEDAPAAAPPAASPPSPPPVGPGLAKASAPAPSNVVPFPRRRAAAAPDPGGDPASEPDADDDAEDVIIPPPPAWGGASALARSQTLERELDAIIDRVANGTHTTLEKTKILQTATHALANLQKLRGEAVAEVNVVRHPKWQELRDRIIAIIREEFGDVAALRLVDRLAGAERDVG